MLLIEAASYLPKVKWFPVLVVHLPSASQKWIYQRGLFVVVNTILQFIGFLALKQETWFSKHQGAVWFTKCNVKGNGNGLHSITGGNKFE